MRADGIFEGRLSPGEVAGRELRLGNRYLAGTRAGRSRDAREYEQRRDEARRPAA
jgi:hypothetical protein